MKYESIEYYISYIMQDKSFKDFLMRKYVMSIRYSIYNFFEKVYINYYKCLRTNFFFKCIHHLKRNSVEQFDSMSVKRKIENITKVKWFFSLHEFEKNTSNEFT